MTATEPLNGDYSHGQAIQWTKWLGHLAGKPNLVALEVGSYEGQSALWFLKNVLANHGKLYCVDTWAGGEDMPEVHDLSLYDTFINNVYAWKDNVHPFVGRSEDSLPKFNREFFDFAYIDGSHTAASVLSDSVLVWRTLKVGGIIIWDDYEWAPHAEPWRHPKLAVDSFLACYEGRYRRLPRSGRLQLRRLKRDTVNIMK